MNRTVFAVVIIGLMAIANKALGETEIVDGVSWTYLVNGSTVSVGGGSSLKPAIPETFSGAIVIPMTLSGKKVTGIGNYAFNLCRGITSVEFPPDMTNIGEGAFCDCQGLSNVEWPTTVARIPDFAFLGCSGLVTADLPDGLLWIGRFAFSECSALHHIKIPSGVTDIGYGAFDQCQNLTQVDFPISITNIGDYAFRNCALTDIVIPYNVMRIGAYSFANCEQLTNVYLPRSCAYSEISFPECATVYKYKYRQLVSFDAAGGDAPLSNMEVTFGVRYGELPIPSREGYVFQGWKCNDGDITSDSIVRTLDDHVLVATWKGNEVRITFDANGGLGGKSFRSAYGTELVVPIVSRTGYTFSGWNPDAPSMVPMNDVTYTAQWKINTHRVIFDANGGIGGVSGVQDYGTAIVAPSVSRAGYSFIRWMPTVLATMPDDDVTYVAQWHANTVTLTIDANEGEGGGVLHMECGSKFPTPAVFRRGYKLIGWQPSLPQFVPASDASYTAIWEIGKYNVVFDANGGIGGCTLLSEFNKLCSDCGKRWV